MADGRRGRCAWRPATACTRWTPWPFAAERVACGTEGRLLQERFSEQECLREAMARAPWVDLCYELRPG